MAVPTDLTAWRAFVRRSLDPLPHERPTGLRAATSEERIASLAGDFVVETPDLSLLMKHLAVLESLALTPSSHSAGMLAVSGPPTWGKTTAGLFLARNHERRKRFGLGDTKLEDESIQPALYVGA
ncbi:hypothetical protein [Galactobacter valiniphilus]|uniref:hypothetical protein n=1 Tax=Galactobacter valiniphilus TaxID=2676122 RepID=UPI0011C41F35|nr:hypothetical protein [Galactobacter valiniphilus]